VKIESCRQKSAFGRGDVREYVEQPGVDFFRQGEEIRGRSRQLTE
jgi:hypothetical protein